MQGEFADGTLLKFWYDYLLAVPVLAVAAYLTVRATISMPWSGRPAGAARVVSILGTASVLLIVLDRFGVETLILSAPVYGYMSVFGAVSAIVVGGIGTLVSSKGPEGRAAGIGPPVSTMGSEGEAEGIDPVVSSRYLEGGANDKRGRGVLSGPGRQHRRAGGQGQERTRHG